ncbi:MAG TPA: hypothetical protein VKB58_09295 [Terriglobales bacterium]|nr:hypothetical protein [Terriglobales bacterium]
MQRRFYNIPALIFADEENFRAGRDGADTLGRFDAMDPGQANVQ